MTSPDRALLVELLAEIRALRAELAGLRAGPGDAPGDPVQAKAAELREAAHARGLTITGDGFVREYDAAALLGRHASTLRNWRYAEQPLPWRRMGGRTEYALTALARHLVEADGE